MTKKEEILALAGTMTQQAIGDRFGVTRQRVQQIFRRAGIVRVRYARIREERAPRPSPEERFWSRVEIGPDCWEWTGSRLPVLGYGRLRWEGRSENAHRAAWVLTHGPIPKGKWILHHCDNPPCVRPDHLFLGTPADNVHDAQAKGRRPTVGSRNPRAKHKRITKDEMDLAMELRRKGLHQAAIARQIGCSPEAVAGLFRRIGLTPSNRDAQ